MTDQLWKGCLCWLKDAKLLPESKNSLWDDAEIYDLAQSLRNGVILCQLMSNICPGSINMEDVSLCPQMSQFLCNKNIRLFLQACSTHLKLSAHQLFQPQMLFDCSDFKRVLHTLSVVSHSKASLNAGLTPFPEKRDTMPSLDSTSEEIYKNLEELTLEASRSSSRMNEGSTGEDHHHHPHHHHDHHPMSLLELQGDSPPHASVGTSAISSNSSIVSSSSHQSNGSDGSGCSSRPSSSRRTHEEDIYEDLCYVSLRNVNATSAASPKTIAIKEKRDYCIKELLETESNYVDALNMIQSYFMKPLKCCLLPDDRSTVFGLVPRLIELHRKFLEDLNSVCRTSGNTMLKNVSACFIKYKNSFIVYGDYCANLPKAQTHLDELCSKNSFLVDKIYQYETQANGGKFKLRDLLSVPVQRILKYHLFIHELIGYTPDSAPEVKAALRNAYEHIIDLGQFINEVKRDSETLQIIADIERSITDLDMPENTKLQDYGRLVRDGELKVRVHDDHKLRSRYVFVFDKVLLMCKATRGEHYSYRQAMILSDYQLSEYIPASYLSVVCGNSNNMILPNAGQHAFFLLHTIKHHVFTFFAKNEEQKSLWMSAIKFAMETTNPPAPGSESYGRGTYHNYIMTTFANPSTCDHCNRLFKGKFFQGYRCLNCYRTAHKQCIANTGKCGFIPQVPPRDASSSKTTLSNARITSLPLPPPPPIPSVSSKHETPTNCGSTPNTTNTTTTFYENLPTDEQPWFAGQMDRETAHETLRQMPHSTYLVRISNKHKSFVLSLNDSGDVKHMRIVVTESGYFYLSQSKYFISLVDLINYYTDHSLAESFVGLDVKLRFQYGCILKEQQAKHQVKSQPVPVASSGSSCSPPVPPAPPVGGTSSGHHVHCESVITPQNTLNRSTCSDSPHLLMHSVNQSECSLQTGLSSGSPAPSSSSGGGHQSTSGQPNYQVLSIAKALYQFIGDSPSLLSFQKNDLIEVLSKAGERKGWWKGRIQGQIGYFPYKYVTEMSDASL